MGQIAILSDFPGFSEWGEFVFSEGKLGSQLKITFDMTTLICSTGGCPLYPFYSLKRGSWCLLLSWLVTENPSRKVATKDHSKSNSRKGNPPETQKQKWTLAKWTLRASQTKNSKLYDASPPCVQSPMRTLVGVLQVLQVRVSSVYLMSGAKKRPTKPRNHTNSTKEFSEQFEGYRVITQ